MATNFLTTYVPVPTCQNFLTPKIPKMCDSIKEYLKMQPHFS